MWPEGRLPQTFMLRLVALVILDGSILVIFLVSIDHGSQRTLETIVPLEKV